MRWDDVAFIPFAHGRMICLHNICQRQCFTYTLHSGAASSGYASSQHLDASTHTYSWIAKLKLDYNSFDGACEQGVLFHYRKAICVRHNAQCTTGARRQTLTQKAIFMPFFSTSIFAMPPKWKMVDVIFYGDGLPTFFTVLMALLSCIAYHRHGTSSNSSSSWTVGKLCMTTTLHNKWIPANTGLM